MLYCPKCGLEYPEGKKFCKNCGSSLIDREPMPYPSNKTIGTLEATIETKREVGGVNKYCQSCGIAYPPEKKFCKTCGGELSVLSSSSAKIAETESASIHKPQTIPTAPAAFEESPGITQKKYCPSCGMEQRIDQRFCKNCGSSLTEAKIEPEILRETTPKPFPNIEFTSPSLKPAVGPATGVPSRPKLMSLLRRKKKLLKAGGNVNTLITNLGAQRGVISENVLNATMKPYVVKMEAIEKEIGGIDNYLKGLQKKMETESENMEEEIRPYKSRLEELKTIRKVKGLTSGDYKRFKREPHQAFKHLGSQIKKRDRILKVLTSPTSRTSFIFDSSVYIKIVVLILAIAILGTGGFFGYTYFFKKEMGTNVPATQSGQPLPPSTSTPPTSTASSEAEIKKVFDTIKQANMTEDINLFMSCYSTAFPNLEEKKGNTIQTWKDMDITALNFAMRDLITMTNTAEVTIDWLITTRSADSGQTETFNTTNNVVLQKEGGQWKIVSLK